MALTRWWIVISCLFITACTSTPFTNTASVVATPSPTIPPTVVPANIQVCNGVSCLSTLQWATNMNAGISPDAVGYAYLIMSHGKVVYEQIKGLARTSTDGPPLPMTAETRMNVASVTKTITAVAALKLLGQKHISLDSAMSPYLPKSWALGPNMTTITFRELLTHRSGMRISTFPESYENLKTAVAQGIQLSNKIYYYDNYNFALFRILIPFITGAVGTNTSDLETATAQGYLEYLNSVYGRYFTITCSEGSNGGSYALAYSLPAGSNSGKDWGDWFTTCGGGGIQMSLDELARFLIQLNQGSFLTADELHQMYQGYLGWDYPYYDRLHGDCITKNGALVWNYRTYSTELSTMVTYCPSLDLGFVALANSPLYQATSVKYGWGFPGTWDDLVQPAYANSWQ